MANLLVPVGIPGSGKSTWVRTILGHGMYAIVSSDEIRKELFGDLRSAHDVDPEEKKKRNRQVWDIFYRKVEDNLEHNVNTVADGTNLRDQARQRLRDITDRTNASIHALVFTNTTQAIRRNMTRDVDMVVPNDVMNDFLDTFHETYPALQIEAWDSYTEIGALY